MIWGFLVAYQKTEEYVVPVVAVEVAEGEGADMVDEEAWTRCEIHRSLNQSNPSENGVGRREE